MLATLGTAPGVTESFISLLEDSGDAKETLVAWQPAGTSNDLATRVASLAKQRQTNEHEHSADLKDQVLHLQAPDCRATYARWGSLRKGKWKDDGLGVDLPVVHLQVKDLGQAMFLDVAVVDDRGELLVVRASTWQVSGVATVFGQSRLCRTMS